MSFSPLISCVTNPSKLQRGHPTLIWSHRGAVTPLAPSGSQSKAGSAAGNPGDLTASQPADLCQRQPVLDGCVLRAAPHRP